MILVRHISSYRQIFGKDSAPGDGYIRRIIDDGSSSDSDTDKPGGSGSSGTLKRKAVTDFLVDDDGEVRFKYLFWRKLQNNFFFLLPGLKNSL